MKISNCYIQTIDNTAAILAATLSKLNEIVILLSDGNVYRHDLITQQRQFLFSTCQGESKNGFDFKKETKIYTMDDIVVIVNDKDEFGYVYYPKHEQLIDLFQDNKYADVVSYPIALFKNAQNVPHLIYAVAWNQLQIRNLDTLEVLTKNKTKLRDLRNYAHLSHLINVDEDRTYDYFFGAIEVSPDQKYFFSRGWDWGSSDSYKAYNIEDFINNERILDIPIMGGEHLSRGACWTKNNIIAYGYNEQSEDDNYTDCTIGSVICFDDIENESNKIDDLATEGIDPIHSTMKFSPNLDSIVIYNKELGVSVVSLKGEILFQNKELKVDSFSPSFNRFITFDKNNIIIQELTN